MVALLADQRSTTALTVDKIPAACADNDSDVSESEDELLTIKDAVQHIVRSARHSRANSSDKLDNVEPASTSSRGNSDPQPPAAEVQPPPASRVTFDDAGHIALPGTSSLPNLATRRSHGGSREVNDMSGSATERSESSEAWSEERIRQLEEDKAAIERLWGEHAQENDIGVLKFKLVGLTAVHLHACSGPRKVAASAMCMHEFQSLVILMKCAVDSSKSKADLCSKTIAT